MSKNNISERRSKSGARGIHRNENRQLEIYSISLPLCPPSSPFLSLETLSTKYQIKRYLVYIKAYLLLYRPCSSWMLYFLQSTANSVDLLPRSPGRRSRWRRSVWQERSQEYSRASSSRRGILSNPCCRYSTIMSIARRPIAPQS